MFDPFDLIVLWTVDIRARKWIDPDSAMSSSSDPCQPVKKNRKLFSFSFEKCRISPFFGSPELILLAESISGSLCLAGILPHRIPATGSVLPPLSFNSVPLGIHAHQLWECQLIDFYLLSLSPDTSSY